MAARAYKLTEDSLQHKFQKSRAKIQIFGGGFGNGKTTSGVIKALQIARDYPGANILLARSTYPKLNDTLRKEFLKWCPAKWIQSKNLSTDNVVVLTNGSTINFRYIAQQGKNNESSTSNLLSATYDLVLVDQIEDPEITHKDFLDLLGRLRGNSRYNGEDETMPTSGPRWMILLCNPTRNWVYRELVKPLHDHKLGIRNPSLLVDSDGEPIIELFEGSTYTNAENLPEDFIATLESSYTGQMRSRFLEGKWGAFEGLVYPQYDPMVHQLTTAEIMMYFDQLMSRGMVPKFIEAYDHGIASPACYGLGFVDHAGRVFEFDGFYEKERTVSELAELIHNCRSKVANMVGGDFEFAPVLADPQIFRRSTGNSKSVGITVSGLFAEEGIKMMRANNDIVSGIAKVQSYLTIDMHMRHPLSDTLGSPRLFFSNELTWNDQEIVDYYWKKDSRGEYEDLPMDRNDHAMDKTKYLLTHRPRIAHFIDRKPKPVPGIMRWREYEANNSANGRSHRHAA
jgi:hypothetical protein